MRSRSLRAALLLLLAPVCLNGQTSSGALELDPRVQLDIDTVRVAGKASIILVEADDGRVFLAGRRGGMPIHIFNADGTLQRSIPLAEVGPDGITDANQMGLIGDTVWIAERARSQILFLKDDFQFIRSVDFRPPDLGAGYLPLVPNRILDAETGLYIPSVVSEMVADGIIQGIPLVRVDFDGDLADTIAIDPTEHGLLAVRSSVGTTFAGQPFSDDILIEYSPDGKVIIVVERPAGDSIFKVHHLTTSGDTVSSVNCTFTPIPIPSSSVAKVIEERATAVAEFGILPMAEALVAVEEQLYLPRALTPVSSVVVGNDASVWLRREPVDAGSLEWNVLDTDGTLIGTTQLPPEARVLVVSRSGAWVVSPQNDRQTILRFDLEESQGAPTGPSCNL